MPLEGTFGPDDPRSSDLKIGIEVEWPEADGDPMKKEAQSSGHIRSQLNDWPLRGRTTNDPSVGLEVVCEPPLDVEDVENWYAECIDYVEAETDGTYAPTGMIHGNTAGLHTHISPLDYEEAELLHEWSSEPWLQVFACSSVCEREAPYYRVFRDNYCRLEQGVRSGDRYAVVNERSSSRGHYEWRLPEPMTVANLGHMMRFLDLFKYDPETAKDYALDVLEDEDEITSIKRADSIGVELNFGERGEVIRSPSPQSGDFWEAVQEDETCPYIYRVRVPDEGEYYAFESRRDDYFTREGVEFNRETILRADSLSPIPSSSDVYQAIESTLQNRNGPRPKEAAKYLKDVMKKKKK